MEQAAVFADEEARYFWSQIHHTRFVSDCLRLMKFIFITRLALLISNQISLIIIRIYTHKDHFNQSGELLPLAAPFWVLLSAFTNAGCSMIASNKRVPRSAFVNGRWPFTASWLYLNSVGHLRYTLFSPCTQSIALKNLVHCRLF